jgi:hypothetical protein
MLLIVTTNVRGGRGGGGGEGGEGGGESSDSSLLSDICNSKRQCILLTPLFTELPLSLNQVGTPASSKHTGTHAADTHRQRLQSGASHARGAAAPRSGLQPKEQLYRATIFRFFPDSFFFYP